MDNKLNPQQEEAARAPQAPLLIVAGAGTGKTTTLTERLVHLIREGVDPWRICALTFTNKAANEMLERVQRSGALRARPETPSVATKEGFRTGSGNREPYIGTFHSLGASILRREGYLAGRAPNFAIFDDHDSFDLIKKVTREQGGEEGARQKSIGRKSAADKKKPAILAQNISRIKNLGNFGGGGGPARGAEQNAETVRAAFMAYERKLKENNAFDFDDLIEKVVRLFREHPAVLRKYREKFSAVLVDEFQDVNPAQYELIKLLAGEHRNLSAVGDDEQLIYGWRYANLDTFLNFESDWPGARVLFLEENYRSTGSIIGGASAVSKHNLKRRPKNLWTKNPAGSPISVTETEDEDREGEFIAEQIQGSRVAGQGSGVAVLYRTNAQSRAIEQALIRRRIPYRIFGGLKFYERKEIKDILAALRFAANDKDEVSRDRLEKTFSEKKLDTIVRHINKNKHLPPREFIELLVEATDYLGYLERNFVNFADRQENISELAEFASRFTALPDMLQEISLVQATDASKGRDDARSESGPEAHLMTVHLAKGLEFDTVFIAGCSEGLLPHGRSLDDEDRLEEERRLMYVAMTRARHDLRISFYGMPSRFLGEIPADLIEFKTLSGNGYFEADSREEFVTLE